MWYLIFISHELPWQTETYIFLSMYVSDICLLGVVSDICLLGVVSDICLLGVVSDIYIYLGLWGSTPRLSWVFQ